MSKTYKKVVKRFWKDEFNEDKGSFKGKRSKEKIKIKNRSFDYDDDNY